MSALHPVFRDVGLADDAAEAAAALWLARSGEAWSGADEAALQAWIAGDPENAEAWADMSEVMGLFDQAEAPDLDPYRQEALKARAAPAPAPPRLTRRLVMRAGLGAGAAAAAAAGIVFLGAEGNWRTYHAEPGERRRFELADGSRLTLDAGAAVRVRFTRDSRDLELCRGQARFEVAKDAARPFAVAVDDHLVVATGTAFNIDRTGARPVVILLEGQVEVRARRSGAVAARLEAGQGYLMGERGERLLLAEADVEQATAWTRGQLVFKDELLESAAGRISRYSPLRPVRVAPAARNLRVSGVFQADDPDAFIEAVSLYLPVSAQRQADGSVELRLKGSAAP